ncbi:hypothetical protein STRCI_008664 [Streptomyces cinnabarinus]|uniref:Uncharacterized protein n=1 Tax=Streptomyces cinnabarinus TaxID=67287 RepID=A0ABY7KQY2_9ACTN|nr:hypothetical protein [Streptomyces cinnabarinus]WAZ18997.1 hypothetical protein STRCI_000011 [Streptomyces cinnabarinus]WAZ26971.1 hypothetical protein STRCI_008664 [Streptomyces cinnabarinus]
MRTATGPSLIPFITQRQGEDAAPDNLLIFPHASGPRLYYGDEDPRDRPLRGVLWARCGFNPLDGRQMPTGAPHWKLMHPYRQMITMQSLHCQVCAKPARTPLGFIFLAGPKDQDPTRPTICTNQPPVCAKHARAAAALCPHLEENPMVFLARSAPLYGVHGTIYGLNARNEVHAVAQPDEPLPFGHPNLPTLLGSQLIRRLSSFRVLDLEELLQELELAA